MGGNALKTMFGKEVERMTSVQLGEFAEDIELTLQMYSLGSKADPVKFYHAKEDHGDLDMVVAGKVPTDRHIQIAFQTELVHKNDTTFSLLYKDKYQVDLIYSDLETYESQLNFRNYSPFGNIFSRLLKQLDVSLKTTGLYYVFRGGDSYVENILLTRNWEQILLYGGLDPLVYRSGFWTQENIFEYVCDSPYFRKSIYAFENLNHVNRKRDRVRPDYNAWNDYIQSKNDRWLDLPDAKANLQRIHHWFPSFSWNLECAHRRYTKRLERKLKFNGVYVQLWTGLEGEELGAFMKSIRESVPSFDNWLDTVTTKEIQSFTKKQFEEFQKSAKL